MHCGHININKDVGHVKEPTSTVILNLKKEIKFPNYYYQRQPLAPNRTGCRSFINMYLYQRSTHDMWISIRYHPIYMLSDFLKYKD